MSLFDLLYPNIFPLSPFVAPGLCKRLLLSTSLVVFCFNRLIKDAISFLVVPS